MNEIVVAALTKAKWNESVYVKIDNENNDLLLVPQLDRLNGGIKWENVLLPYSSYKAGDRKIVDNIIIDHHIRTKIWIFPMLNDSRRNRMYAKAIDEATKEVADIIPIDDQKTLHRLPTLDIGSGTGLLALLSAEYLKENIALQNWSTVDNIQIKSIEMASPMATLAKRTVLLNRYKEEKDCHDLDYPFGSCSIDVIEGHSCHIPSMKSGNDKNSGAFLCTSELLESGLLGEGWLPAMRDAWNRHLHSTAVVVPQKARIYVQLIGRSSTATTKKTKTKTETSSTNTASTTLLSNFVGPYQTLDMGTNKKKLHLSTTSDNSGTLLSSGSNNGGGEGIQIEIHAKQFLKQHPSIKLLSNPLEVLDFDVTSPDKIPSPNPLDRTPNKITFVPIETGIAEGVLFWWELDLYDDITYSTYCPHNSKDNNAFQDHWHQCLYIFPYNSDDEESTSSSPSLLEKGKESILLASHTDSRVHFSLDTDTDNVDVNEDDEKDNSNGSSNNKRLRRTIPEPNDEGNPSCIISPRRCWQLNDINRTAKLRNGIQFALDTLIGRTSDANVNRINVLDISDFSLCGIMASILSSSTGIGAKGGGGGSNVHVTSIESSSGGIPLAAAKVAQIGNGLCSSSNFQIVQCHAETITNDVIIGEQQKRKKENDINSTTTTTTAPPAITTTVPSVSLVIGEPYYEMLEGWNIEIATNYFYTLRMLKRNNIVKKTALCVPAQAVVYACGISCSDLGNSYKRNIGDDVNSNNNNNSSKICGFDHQTVTDCWNYNEHGFSIPLFDEYSNVIKVTDIVEIGTYDYENNTIKEGIWIHDEIKNDNDDGNDKDGDDDDVMVIHAPFTKENETCHAIVFWIDYRIRIKNDDDDKTKAETNFEIISTGESSPSSSSSSSYGGEKQTVRILSEPIMDTILGKSLPIYRHGLKL